MERRVGGSGFPSGAWPEEVGPERLRLSVERQAAAVGHRRLLREARVELDEHRSLLRQHRGQAPLELGRSEEHTSELQSRLHLVCRLLLEKKKTSRASATHSE